MQKRRLGRTGLEVTQLGYGANELRGPRIRGGRFVTEEQAERILNAVLDAGINFIDTSCDYGLSEEYIGRFISHRRKVYYLATKCGCSVVNAGDYDDTLHVWTRDNLLHNIEASLRRMKTDYVDVWQLHNPPVKEVQAGDLVKVMQEVKAAGKVRWIGISTTLPEITTYVEWGMFDTFQIPYSGLERAHENVITAAARAGAGTIIRGGVARGSPENVNLGYKGGVKTRLSDLSVPRLIQAIRKRAKLFLDKPKDRWAIWEKAKLDELRAPDESRVSFLLRMTLSHSDIHTTIVGTMNSDHLVANLRAAQSGPLPLDVYAEAKRRLDMVGEKPTASYSSLRD